MRLRGCCAFVAALLVGGLSLPSLGAPVHPISYDMPNGQTGSWHYWDRTYTGSGANAGDLVQLSGGLGYLTDGLIPNQNWNVVAGEGYVGWATIDPTITFHFSGNVSIDSVTVSVDDADGGGGVLPPASADVTMGSTTFAAIPIADPPGPAPFTVTFSTPGLSGSELDLTLHRTGGAWIMLSEVSFNGIGGATAAPLPAAAWSGLLLLLPLAIRRRARRLN